MSGATRSRFPGLTWDSKKLATIDLMSSGRGGAKRRRVRVEVQADTRMEAEGAWRREREKLERPPAGTFGQYVERYWPDMSASVSTSTAALADDVLTRHLLPFFGKLRL